MIAAALALQVLQGNTFELLPELPGADYSSPLHLSSTGEAIVGFAFFKSGGRAVRWIGDKIELLSVPEGAKLTNARGVSKDGKVVVGFIREAGDRERSVIWRDNVATLGHPGIASDVSADGETVIGYRPGTRFYQGVWTSAGKEGVVPNPDGTDDGVIPDAISDDGNIIVGHAYDKDLKTTGVRWDRRRAKSEVLVGLPDSSSTSVLDVSADGSVAIGRSTDKEQRRHIFVWNRLGRAEEILKEQVEAGWSLTTFGGAHLDPKGEVALLNGRTKDREYVTYLWRRGEKLVTLASLLPNAPKLGVVSDLVSLPDGRILIVGSTEDDKGFRAVVKL